MRQKQKQSVKQETNVTIKIGDHPRTKNKKQYSKPKAEKEQKMQQQATPSFSFNPVVTMPSFLPTNYQPPINNKEPVKVSVNVPVDNTPFSGQVPASFIPSEAPTIPQDDQFETIRGLVNAYEELNNEYSMMRTDYNKLQNSQSSGGSIQDAISAASEPEPIAAEPVSEVRPVMAEGAIGGGSRKPSLTPGAIYQRMKKEMERSGNWNDYSNRPAYERQAIKKAYEEAERNKYA